MSAKAETAEVMVNPSKASRAVELVIVAEEGAEK